MYIYVVIVTLQIIILLYFNLFSHSQALSHFFYPLLLHLTLSFSLSTQLFNNLLTTTQPLQPTTTIVQHKKSNHKFNRKSKLKSTKNQTQNQQKSNKKSMEIKIEINGKSTPTYQTENPNKLST